LRSRFATSFLGFLAEPARLPARPSTRSIMHRSKLRRHIAWEAARLIHAGRVDDWYQACRAVIRHDRRGRVRQDDLPSEAEVRDELLGLAGHPRRGGSPSGEASDAAAESEQATAETHQRFQRFAELLHPLEQVWLDPETHPEGDALYHSLQVFALARAAVPYDEELLLAALLHEVGRAIDPRHSIPATLEALRDLVSPRTAWLIEHLEDGHQLRTRTSGFRKRRRLSQHPWFEDLLHLCQWDQEGRVVGARVGEVPQALRYLEALEGAWGEGPEDEEAPPSEPD
jgi:hypothetical protein